MSATDGAAIARSVIAGALSGMRSAAGPALAAWQLKDQRVGRRDRLPRRLLAAEHAPQVAAALATGELLADKHPNMPNRTDVPSLVGRAAAGALAAVALVPRRASMRVMLAHALIGAGAAILTTHLSYHARRRLARANGHGDRLVALAEDALTYGGGALALRRLR